MSGVSQCNLAITDASEEPAASIFSDEKQAARKIDDTDAGNGG